MIIFGGNVGINIYNDGGMYKQATNSWTTIPPAGAIKVNNHATTWGGGKLYVTEGSSSLLMVQTCFKRIMSLFIHGQLQLRLGRLTNRTIAFIKTIWVFFGWEKKGYTG